MSEPVSGALVTAGLLGVTHAIEPDHVAGISSLTSRHADSRLSALVGACFSVGHVVLVVLWLGVGYLLLGRTDYAPVFDVVGTLGVALLLGTLGVAMVVGGFRSVRYAHEHDGHAHGHVRLPGLGRAAPDHDHGVRTYLETGLVGALFTLSPPLSMIAFAATLFPAYGGGVVALSVVVYAVGITVTMSALGAGVGTVFDAATVSERAHGLVRVLAGVVVAGLAVSILLGALPALA